MQLNLRAGLAAGLLLATPLSALAQDTATETPAVEYDAGTVLATVNGEEITLGHVVAVRERLPQQYQTAPDDVLFDGILNQLIDQALLSKSPDAGDNLPLGARLVLENEERSLVANFAAEKILEREVTDETIQALYDERYASADAGQEYNASHILVESEDEAKGLVETLNGGADFAELAKEKSTGPSGPQGGELGWFGPGMMVPEFEQAVVDMEVGAISEPIQTQFGWHVIKLNETRAKEPPALDAVRAELEAEVQQTTLQTAIDTLREAADITQNTDGIPPVAVRETDLLRE